MHAQNALDMRSTDAGRMASLPRWPFAAMLGLFPLWWASGVAEMAWVPLAGVMMVLMIRRGEIRVPRGFGLWLLFLVLMSVSVIGIDTSGRLVGFAYRALLYATVTITFVYVYNAGKTMPTTYVLGLFTVFWLWTVIGGFAGMIAPEFAFRTPLGYILPASLQSNELIGEMTVRRLTQFNPDSWLALDPRPSAPFLYTNGWGNVYSITLPMVVAYITKSRSRRARWGLGALIPLSLIPAFATLNRGMFIGLTVAAGYLLLRLTIAGRLKETAILAAGGVIGVVGAIALDVGSRLTDRVETSSSTQDRANLYEETFARTLESPLFGYGAPRPSLIDGAPSAGTQGHLWMVMFSHGFPALLCFIATLVWMFVATWRTRDIAMHILHAVQLVTIVEIFFYGVLPYGLILSFAAAAVAMRERTSLAEPRRSR